jgi:NAD(P)-dependent dehydrogenase (short-subunit alcohol dehydrogenase family)
VVSPGGIGLPPDRQLTQYRGQPEDVAAMILAVLSNPAVTNAKIDVDGGERTGDWSGG